MRILENEPEENVSEKEKEDSPLELIASAEILVASPAEVEQDSQPETTASEQLEDDQVESDQGLDKPLEAPSIQYDSLAPAQASPSPSTPSRSITFDLSPEQITETNQIFDLLQAQPWDDNQAFELSADSLGLTTDSETLSLLFDLSLESLTNPEVQQIL